ncbi:MAG: hypothetical protein P8188_11915 [Gemmatimonadota bacterium]
MIAPSPALGFGMLPEEDDGHAAEPSPYAGRVAVLATKHGKERAVAPAMAHLLGLEVVVPDQIDTDVLGTFSGDVARPGSMLQTAVAKARLGMALEGRTLGLASEGRYGVHPRVPILRGGLELMVLVDGERDLVIHQEMVMDRLRCRHWALGPEDDVLAVAEEADFPAHGLLVRPAAPPGPSRAVPVCDVTELAAAVAREAARSEDGRAVIFNDMRADRNPARMMALDRLAHRLARRVRTSCPNCSAPGFGLLRRPPGLPCQWCGTPSTMVSGEVHGCVSCDYREERGRSDGLTVADPGSCLRCNP